MTYHILNGDALFDRFLATGINGEVVITRECLIDGDLSGDSLPDFYKTRSAYLSRRYKEAAHSYWEDVAGEFDKLEAAPPGSEFNLWFGYDLFCAANMWFVLSLLASRNAGAPMYVVYPSHLPAEQVWLDFGKATPAQLQQCYSCRVALRDTDLRLAGELWRCYKGGNLQGLSRLLPLETPAFPYLREIVQAHIDRFPADGSMGRPQQTILDLLRTGYTDFPSLFRAFSEKEGIYGFGDSQVKQMQEELTGNDAGTRNH